MDCDDDGCDNDTKGFVQDAVAIREDVAMLSLGIWKPFELTWLQMCAPNSDDGGGCDGDCVLSPNASDEMLRKSVHFEMAEQSP